MSKRTSIACYNLIINKLRKAPASFAEINDHLERESDIQGEDLVLSMRTFQRYVVEISSLYNIEIEYNFSDRKYHIVEDQIDEASTRMLEAFDIYNTLNLREDLGQYIQFEKRRAQGAEHFYGLLHAIKNKALVELHYQKFWDEHPTKRIIKPMTLKEFKGRWYLLAKGEKEDGIKTFGLDRIKDFTVLKKKFTDNDLKSIQANFQHCFGIICPAEVKPEKIVLSFNSGQGHYIKTFPLHASQKITKDDESEFRIELYLKVTHDFVSELLSYGNDLSIIGPASLKKEMRRIFAEGVRNN